MSRYVTFISSGFLEPAEVFPRYEFLAQLQYRRPFLAWPQCRTDSKAAEVSIYLLVSTCISMLNVVGM